MLSWKSQQVRNSIEEFCADALKFDLFGKVLWWKMHDLWMCFGVVIFFFFGDHDIQGVNDVLWLTFFLFWIEGEEKSAEAEHYSNFLLYFLFFSGISCFWLNLIEFYPANVLFIFFLWPDCLVMTWVLSNNGSFQFLVWDHCDLIGRNIDGKNVKGFEYSKILLYSRCFV